MRRHGPPPDPPSEAEAEAQHRRWLASKGCGFCDEDNADNLEVEQMQTTSCPAVQAPPDPRVVVCGDHSPRSVEERVYEQARRRDERRDDIVVAGLAYYDCGNITMATAEVFDGIDESVYEHPHEQPTAPVECRCGAPIIDFQRLEDIDD